MMTSFQDGIANLAQAIQSTTTQDNINRFLEIFFHSTFFTQLFSLITNIFRCYRTLNRKPRQRTLNATSVTHRYQHPPPLTTTLMAASTKLAQTTHSVLFGPFSKIFFFSFVFYLPMSHSQSCGKCHNPSYIPRPSNLFILFH